MSDYRRYRIETAHPRATVNGRKNGRLVRLYEDDVHDGLYFVPASVRNAADTLNYVLDVRAERAEHNA